MPCFAAGSPSSSESWPAQRSHRIVAEVCGNRRQTQSRTNFAGLGLATTANLDLRPRTSALLHAKKAMSLTSGRPEHWSKLGVALYRSAISECAGKAPKADEMHKGGYHHRFFLMAYGRLARDKARTALTRRALDGYASAEQRNNVVSEWRRRVVEEVIHPLARSMLAHASGFKNGRRALTCK